MMFFSEFNPAGNGPCVSKVKSGKTGFILMGLDLYLIFTMFHNDE
jgi:hypothetical protein